MVITPVGNFAFFAASTCQVPFSPKAKSPVRNSSQVVFWEFWITEFGARPCLTQSVHSCSAEIASGESSWVSLAPAPQNHGRNWKEPSSVPMPAKVMPL